MAEWKQSVGYSGSLNVEQKETEGRKEGRNRRFAGELFFVDLPNETERQAIWSIVISRYARDPDEFDIAQLAKAMDALTGSEIEQAFIEALYAAFDQETEPTDLTIAQVLNDLVPLSKLMAEQITGLRNWARGRARMATSEPAPERRARKLAA